MRISILSFLILSSCGSLQGPSDLKTADYHPLTTDKSGPTVSAPLQPQAGNQVTTKAKIENDLAHPPSNEPLDDQSDQNVFEHLPSKTIPPGTNTTKMNFDWPVDEAKLSRGFINQKRKHHWGLDLANKKGTSILAAENGYVVYTGKQFHGYGRLIVIEHNDRWATLYAHLDKFSVKEGDFVKRGQEIGEMGRSGHATGSHLHFELRDNRKPVDPLVYMPAQ